MSSRSATRERRAAAARAAIRRRKERRARTRAARDALGGGEAPRLPYELFLAERQRFIEARQRQQQRADQLVTGGAAGALALSITFLEKIAPNPSPATRPILLVAWTLLLVSLGLTLRAHHVSCDAFDRAIGEFDDCFERGAPYGGPNEYTRRAGRLAAWGARAFVAGVAFLAAFAFANLYVAPPQPAVPPTPRPADDRAQARPAASVPAPPAAATEPLPRPRGTR